MHDVFAILEPADYGFLVGLVESNVSFTDNQRLRHALARLEAEDTPETRAEMNRVLEREVRYVGSADVAYFVRFVQGKEPGVSFREIVNDVARALKVEVDLLGTDREVLERIVEAYATQQFARLAPDEQQQLLESLGVDRDRAARFIKTSAGVFSVPLLIQAFDAIVVQGLIKNVIFGAIARIIGRQLSGRLFGFLAARLPWWVAWVGPVAWTASLGWAALDLQRPALRKTIPVVLYLGLCSLRSSNVEVRSSKGRPPHRGRP